MVDVATNDTASEVLTLAAETEYDAESLYRRSIDDDSDESSGNYITQASVAAQATKAIEAASEQVPIPALDVPSSGQSVRRSSLGSEYDVAIRDAGPATAPPDYAAATADRSSPPTIDHSGLSDENHGDDSHSRREIEDRDAQHYDVELQAQSTDHNATSESPEPGEELYSFTIVVIQEVQKLMSKLIAQLDNEWTRAAWEPTREILARLDNERTRAAWMTTRKLLARLDNDRTRAAWATAKQLIARLDNDQTRAAWAMTKKQISRLDNEQTRAAWAMAKTQISRLDNEHTRKACRVAANAVVRLNNERTRAIWKSAVTVVLRIDNKHTRQFMRRHWHTVFLGNIAFTFILLFLITSRKRPRYIEFDVQKEYFSMHPRESNAWSFHPYIPHSAYSDFKYIRVEHSGNFSLKEALDFSKAPWSFNGSLTGRIDVRPAPLAQSVPIEVWYNVAQSVDEWVPASPSLVQDDQGVQLHMPPFKETDASHGKPNPRFLHALHPRPRMDIWIGIYVAISMENFAISTDNFDVNIDNVHEQSFWGLSVNGEIRISAKGSVKSPAFVRSNETKIQSGGSIDGTFILQNKVELSAGDDGMGGGLDATIKHEPRLEGMTDSWTPISRSKIEALKRMPPSILRTEASGGKTYVRYSRLATSVDDAKPSRWPINNSTVTHSSGSISGILERAGKSLQNLYSLDAFHASSSDMYLHYPWKWNGTIQGSTRYGSVYMWPLDGWLLDDHSTPEMPREELNATRGDSISRIVFNASDSNVNVYMNNWEPYR